MAQLSVNLAFSMRHTLFRRSTRVRQPVSWYDAAESGVSFLWSMHVGPGQWLRFRQAHHGRPAGRKNAVVEHAGLLLTTALARTNYQWDVGHAPLWVDDDYDEAGVRPDLIFRLDTGTDLAGEARGRTGSAPGRVWQTQADRVEELRDWAAGPRGTQWFMAWAWIGDNRTVVDLFDPGEPREIADIEASSARKETVLDEWHRSAPYLDIDMAARSVRGDWIEVQGGANDDGPHWLLLLVAGAAQEPWPVSEAAGEEFTGGWELSVGERTIVAITSELARPTWDETSDRIAKAVSG